MRSPDLVRFFMRAVVLLIFFLLGWFFVASWFAMPVGWLAGKMAGLFFPWASAGVDIQGVKVDLLTQLRVPDPAGFVEGRMAMASPEVDYRLFGYGLPLFVALLLASDAQRFGKKLMIGAPILIAVQSIGMIFAWLKQIAFDLGHQLWAQTGFSAFELQVIALGYQLSNLLLPTLVPIVLWGFFERSGFLADFIKKESMC